MNTMFVFDCRTYSAIAMLPIILGEKRFVMYGGVEDSKQVITVSIKYLDIVLIWI